MTVRNPLTMMFMDDEYRVQDCKVWGTSCTGICFACCVYKGGAAKIFLKLSTSARPFPTPPPPPFPPPPQHQNNKKMLPTSNALYFQMTYYMLKMLSKWLHILQKKTSQQKVIMYALGVIIKREEIVDIIYLYMFWWSQHKNIIAREQLIFTRLQWMHDIHNLLIRWALQVQALSYLFISSHYMYVKKLWG